MRRLAPIAAAFAAGCAAAMPNVERTYVRPALNEIPLGRIDVGSGCLRLIGLRGGLGHAPRLPPSIPPTALGAAVPLTSAAEPERSR